MDIQVAQPTDLPAYISVAQVVQAWLREQGLQQYVPAAHTDYEPQLRQRCVNQTLYVVRVSGQPHGYFALEPTAPWWWTDGVPALYLSGIVVPIASRHLGVGTRIVRWALLQASSQKRRLRLDCHAGNPWLCAYYERLGFVPLGNVEQHPGYVSVLFEHADAPVA